MYFFVVVRLLRSMGMILSFLSDSFFFFLTCLLCLWESCKRIKDGKKKTRILLYSDFILWFNNYSVLKFFSCTSRSSHISQTRCWNILESFLMLKVWSLSFVQWVFSVRYILAETAANRTNNLLLIPGLSEHMLPFQYPRETSPFNLSDNCLSEREFFFDARKPIFQACADFASCQRPSGKTLHFEFIYFIFLFIFFKSPHLFLSNCNI